MTDENGLKNCPFCDGTSIVDESYEDYGLVYKVICDKCNCRGDEYFSEKSAIEAWNKRTPVIPAAEIDEALKALDRLDAFWMATEVDDCTNKARSVLNKMRGV